MKDTIQFIQQAKNHYYFMVLVVMSLLLTACINEELCEDVESVSVRMGFYIENPNNNNPLNATIARLTVFGLGMDSVIYDNRTDVGQVELPLDPTTDSCAFVFVYPPPPVPESNPIPNDTIWFVYERIPVLISMECGFANFFLLEEIRHTRNVIDFIEIDEPNITSSLNEHVKIFPFADPVND